VRVQVGCYKQSNSSGRNPIVLNYSEVPTIQRLRRIHVPGIIPEVSRQWRLARLLSLMITIATEGGGATSMGSGL